VLPIVTPGVIEALDLVGDLLDDRIDRHIVLAAVAWSNMSPIRSSDRQRVARLVLL